MLLQVLALCCAYICFIRASFSFNAVTVWALSCAWTADDFTTVASEIVEEEDSVAGGAVAGLAAPSSFFSDGTCNPFCGICSGVLKFSFYFVVSWSTNNFL